MATKKKTKPKARRRAAAKPRPTKKRAAPARKPAEKRIQQPTQEKEVAPERKFILALRLKGGFGVPSFAERTLTSMHLKRKFNAVLLEDRPNLLGMLRDAKDYLTWGQVKGTDIAALLRERGEIHGGLAVTDETVRQKFGEESIDRLATALIEGRTSLQALWAKGLSPVFRMHPPSGGFQFSTKRNYHTRGELGDRGPEISRLAARMM